MPPSSSYYETDQAIGEYALFHYGAAKSLLADGIGPVDALDFPRRCAALSQRQSIRKKRALDLGAAVGGATCHLSKDFDEVVGIDFSQGLIEFAQRIVREGYLTIRKGTEGNLFKETQVSLPPGTRPERIRFCQGDAMDLDPEIGQFDFVLLANLIDRLPDPRRCLSQIHTVVAENGLLAITSPYTWMECYTPSSKWLGGYYEGNRPVRSEETLHEILSPYFRSVDSLNLPFIIREHERKSQYSVAHATLWRKRS